MQNLSAQFADMIKAIMKQNNINQSELRAKMSKVAGYEVKQPFVNRALSGNVNLTLNSMSMICAALNVELSFTFKSNGK